MRNKSSTLKKYTVEYRVIPSKFRLAFMIVDGNYSKKSRINEKTEKKKHKLMEVGT